tara:strand:+ start:9206 stop:9595 length:390 start_codon:yes stop_codon:yes gene_type:complete
MKKLSKIIEESPYSICVLDKRNNSTKKVWYYAGQFRYMDLKIAHEPETVTKKEINKYFNPLFIQLGDKLLHKNRNKEDLVRVVQLIKSGTVGLADVGSQDISYEATIDVILRNMLRGKYGGSIFYNFVE